MENINNTVNTETPIQSFTNPTLSIQKQNNTFKYLFVICFIFLLVSVSYSVLNINNLKPKTEPIEQKTNVISEVTPTIIPNNRYIYTYIDDKVIYEWGTDYASEKAGGSLLYTSVRLPQINSTTEVAKSINIKILDNYKDVIDVVKDNILERKYGKGAVTQNIDYKYELKDNIAYILINNFVAAFRASGGVGRENIFYDVKNDKQFTVVEMLTKLKITEDMIFNEIKSKYPDFEGMEESQIRDAIKNNKEDSITIMPEISWGWYTLYLKVGLPEYEIRIHP